MILTASILWAVLASGGCIVMYIFARMMERWAREALLTAKEFGEHRDIWRNLAIDLQDKIDRDASKRSSITSRGNITRAAKRRALVQAKAAEMRAVPQARPIAA